MNNGSGRINVNIELDASEHHDFYIHEHTEFFDVSARITSPGGISCKVEALIGGNVEGSPVTSSTYAPFNLPGTWGATANPEHGRNTGPSVGFRITNMGVSRAAFTGTIAWSFANAR